jgi:hypothetical protein|tara:strand:- start:124 stop:279 length:156 start_codon:yes stop_codon:yes gene_type:complete
MVKVKAFYGRVKTPTIWTFKTREKAVTFSKGIKKTGWKRITLVREKKRRKK